MADIFCSTDQSEYTQVDCGIDQAGIVATGYIDPTSASVDFGDDTDDEIKTTLETEAFWNDLLSESPATLFIATKTRGEYPGGTPTEEDGFGKESTQVTGAAHEATTEFEGIEQNRNFVEGINRRKWFTVFVTNGGKGIFVRNPVTVYGKLNVPRGITTAAFWMVSHKWQEYSNPIVFDVPDGIFDE